MHNNSLLKSKKLKNSYVTIYPIIWNCNWKTR